MKKCVALAIVLLICFTLFNLGIQDSQEKSGLEALIIIVPLAIAMSAFFTWTNQALKATLVHLETRRQTYKIHMYTMIRRVLMFDIGLIFILSTAGMFFYAGRGDAEWLAANWSWIWFMQLIAFYWRPTSNNARYGLEELPDVEHGYDLEMAVATGGPTGQDGFQNRRGFNGAPVNTNNPVVFELHDGEVTGDESDASPGRETSKKVYSVGGDEDFQEADLSGYQAARQTTSLDQNDEARNLRQEFSKLQ